MMLTLMSMIIVGGITGVLMRWGAGGGPWSILAVNAVGSLIAGWVAGLERPEPWATAVIVGLCGGLTTFSGFALLSVRMLEAGEIFKMAFHFCLNNALCLSLCYAGFKFAQKL